MFSGISVLCFAACYAIALGLDGLGLRSRAGWHRAALVGVTAAGIAAHTLYLAYHATGDSGLPASTAADWLLLAGWVLSLVYFAALFYLPRSPTGVVLLPMVLGLVIGSRWASTEPLAPEQTFQFWRVFHGLVLLLGTVAVCVGFLAGVMYLVQSYALKHVRSAANGLRLPSLEWLEHVNSRTLGLSAVLIALGFASGLAMSSIIHRGQAAYVLWTDPVVLSLAAMLLWLVAAEVFRWVYPAARRGRKVAYLTLASFGFLVIALASLMLLDTVHGAQATDNESVAPVREASVRSLPCNFGLRIADCRLVPPVNPKSEIRNPKSSAWQIFDFIS
jgi:ABC-type uncharacterized transport system permease subunit